MEKEISLSVNADEIVPIIERSIANVRDELLDNPYIDEALTVLKAGGYRSAIGCFWNAVIDDLRNKVMHRSLALFNKSVSLRKEVKTYEDFQNHVNDDELIEGAYKIGVIGWEASKVLKHAKETRHIFDGHPKSSNPSVIKVLAMMDDCTKYVLKEDYPPQIIDIDEYIGNMNETSFDRNKIAIEIALGDLPEIYKNELANRLFTTYIHSDSSTTIKSNIEFVTPILWKVLPKNVKVQVIRRLDQEIPKGVKERIDQSFKFVELVDGNRYLSNIARRYVTEPLISRLKDNLDNWSVEDECVDKLKPYAPFIPDDLMEDYVWSITHTYVGRVGSSDRFSRIDFYANGAAIDIPEMIEAFDDNAAQIFINTIRTSRTLIKRINNPVKLRRLRSLGNIVHEKVSERFEENDFLELLIDESKEKEFIEEINRSYGKEKKK